MRHLVWSAGLFGLLGLDGSVTKPSFELLESLTHRDDRVGLENLERHPRGSRVIDRDLRVIRPNGSLRWLSHKAEVFVDGTRNPTVAIGVLIDITARVEALRERDAAEARIQTLTRMTLCFTWITRANGETLPSRAWLDITGHVPTLGDNEGWLECVHEADRERTRRAWLHAIQTRTPYAAKYRLLCRDGIMRWFIARGTPIFDDRGQLREWFGVAMDISDVKPVDDPYFSVLRGGGPTGPLLKAARALLDWSINDLAAKSGVSISSIRRVESESGSVARDQTTDRLMTALKGAGIEFCQVDDHGVFVRRRAG
jgi:PAS domain S-box-containing protein